MASKRDAARARKRMKLIVGRLQEYVRTYSDQAHYEDYSDTIFIDDMLYGIGIALEPLAHQGAYGFQKFKDLLRERLSVQQPSPSGTAPTVTDGGPAEAGHLTEQRNGDSHGQ